MAQLMECQTSDDKDDDDSDDDLEEESAAKKAKQSSSAENNVDAHQRLLKSKNKKLRLESLLLKARL